MIFVNKMIKEIIKSIEVDPTYWQYSEQFCRLYNDMNRVRIEYYDRGNLHSLSVENKDYSSIINSYSLYFLNRAAKKLIKLKLKEKQKAPPKIKNSVDDPEDFL